MRKDINKHVVNDCTELKETCKYANIGCKWRGSKIERVLHVQSCVMMVVKEMVDQLEQKLETQQSKIEKLQKTVKTQQAIISSLNHDARCDGLLKHGKFDVTCDICKEVCDGYNYSCTECNYEECKVCHEHNLEQLDGEYRCLLCKNTLDGAHLCCKTCNYKCCDGACPQPQTQQTRVARGRGRGRGRRGRQQVAAVSSDSSDQD